jgi:Kef-type K+ transport system membrane component KefB
LVLNILETTLPINNPVLEFLLILTVILLAPILLNKIKIPHLLGLIIAGAVIGPKGINLLERDSGIILSGTAGLLYIMFLAGLEIDLNDFKKNSRKSLVFGIYTFVIPMLIGTIGGYYLLQLPFLSSVLLASMFASHTLIAYPLVSKMGVAKNTAVNITVGGTVITDTLALLVLAIVVGMTEGEVGAAFWTRLSVSITVFGLIVLFVFPIIGRWFLKKFDDNVTQFIFVLLMMYNGAILAELAGLEPIIGAFLTGLALNKLIPHTSALMNRIEFVGNAIFIPFFLIGVGMLIDYRAFFKDWETLKVAGVMIAAACISKFLAAWLTQKTFRFSADQRRLIFGLSSAQAAATLAAVLVGYNIIIGQTPTGEPIRLLSESILNGTILMILVTCTIASFVAQKGANNLALAKNESTEVDDSVGEEILIPLNNAALSEGLIELGILAKSKKSLRGFHGLGIVDTLDKNAEGEKNLRKVLSHAAVSAAATDHILHELIRYDDSLVNGIANVIKENKITDLILGVDKNKGISESFEKNLLEGILVKSNVTTLLFNSTQPLGTIKRHIVVVPKNAERVMGFPFWIIKIWNLAKNSGSKVVFYAEPSAAKIMADIQAKHPIDCSFEKFEDWNAVEKLLKEGEPDDNFIFILSRRNKISYQPAMNRLNKLLNGQFLHKSFMLVYPMQYGVLDDSQTDYKNTSLNDSIEKLDEIRKSVFKLFRKK